MKRKAISFLLVLVLALSLLPVPAYAAAGVKISSTNFPDTKFRNYVRTFDKNNNGTLSDLELAEVKEMYASSRGIGSLKGVEYFTALTKLYCDNNSLKTLDVSKNTALKELYCADNKLTALDLSKNTKLTALGAAYNSIKTVNVTKCTRLTYLDCWSNQLTALDVSKNTKLEALYIGHNKLTALNIGSNTKLESLDCIDNKLTKLDISKNKALMGLSCAANSIKTLNIGASSSLIGTYVMGDEIPLGTAFRYEYGDSYLIVDYATKVTGYQIKITAQPKTQVVSAGNAATFTVTAKGEDLHYQWYYMRDDDTMWHMTGSDSSTLNFGTNKYETVGYKFYCGVTCYGARETLTATSETARLIFMQIPTITTQPKSASVEAGKTATFKVKAAGGGLKYQWFVMKHGTTVWAKLSGKTTPTLKLTAKKAMNGNKYRCQVKNDRGLLYTKAVKLTVK